MEWICWLFPACISKTIIYKRNKIKQENLCSIKELFGWASWVVMINSITLTIIMYYLGMNEIVVDTFSSIPFAFKYLLIATGFAIVLPYILEVLTKFINVSLEIDKIN